MTDDDVMVVFDTKGDFREEFYRPTKDVVISSDSKATDYWNIFKEVLINGNDKAEENLLEIVNQLFEEKIRRSNAPFFPQAAKDVLFGIMSYIIYKNFPEDLDNAELYAYLRDANINDVVDALMSVGDLRGIIDYIYNGGEANTRRLFRTEKCRQRALHRKLPRTREFLSEGVYTEKGRQNTFHRI